MTTNRPLRVFLCHSSNDKPAVRELYQKLRAKPWIQPWLDEEELYPGQDWNMEIEKAVEAADAIIVCLTKGSITKEGYVQRELRIVLDFADYKPEGTLYIIPVRLEECEPPRRLRPWQYADYFEGNRERALQRLLVSLKRRADSLDLKLEQPITKEMKLIAQEGKEVPDWFIDVANEALRVGVPASNKITLSNGMEFMRVPAGKFIMGSDDNDDNGDIDENPQHIVDIDYDYWIARYPVTNEAYDNYVKGKKIEHPVLNWKKLKDHPVVNVNWHNAVDYCIWLNNLHQNELPSNLLFRLPTEAEWEKAARGTDGRKYPWGNIFDSNKCNTKEGGIGKTSSVNLFSPHGNSPYDCADMAGNVFEWTHSVAMDYPYQISPDREDEKSKYVRITRGGQFDEENWVARCACRSLGNLDDKWSGLGFRIVASLPINSFFGLYGP